MLTMNQSKTPVMKSKKRPAFGESRVDDYTTGYGVVSERAQEQKQRKNILQMGSSKSNNS